MIISWICFVYDLVHINRIIIIKMRLKDKISLIWYDIENKTLKNWHIRNVTENLPQITFWGAMQS